MYDDGMQCSGVQWNGSMECNAVEWNAMDAFWSFWVILTLLVILCPNLVVFVQKRKKVNSSDPAISIFLLDLGIFGSFWVILTFFVILGPNLFFFAPKRKKVNFATRRRQIHPTT